jgi:signal-transduction protein with cAMP-binding, CBS, and nucleotidyltransferase domain
MAINPVWRKTLPQWRVQTSRWISRRSTIAMRLCDILFDFRGVYGRHQLAHDLGSHVLETIAANFGFLRDMFGIQAEHRAGLGWFGRLQRERKDREHRGQINLKYAGTLPLAEGVRLLALRHGIRPTSTLARIEALAEASHLRHDEQDYLKGAFDHITGLQLRQQIKDYERGLPVGNWIEPEVLTLREMDMLKDAFRAINAFRDRIRVELTGELF